MPRQPEPIQLLGVRDLRLGDAVHRPSRHQAQRGVHQGNVERVGDDVQEDLALFEGCSASIHPRKLFRQP